MSQPLEDSMLIRRIEHVGDRVLDAVEVFGRFALLVWLTARAALRPRFPLRETARQMESIGVRSLTIVILTALFTGMVLALQTGIALARFGAKPYVGSVIGLSLARELGSVLTASRAKVISSFSTFCSETPASFSSTFSGTSEWIFYIAMVIADLEPFFPLTWTPSKAREMYSRISRPWISPFMAAVWSSTTFRLSRSS